MNLSENRTFEFRKNNWLILIKETPITYEGYIQNENIGIIKMMYGLSKEDIDIWEFIELIEEDLEEYKFIYKEEYML